MEFLNEETQTVEFSNASNFLNKLIPRDNFL